MKVKDKFIKSVLHSINESSAESSDRTKAEIDKLRARNAELDRMYIKLYEDEIKDVVLRVLKKGA